MNESSEQSWEMPGAGWRSDAPDDAWELPDAASIAAQAGFSIGPPPIATVETAAPRAPDVAQGLDSTDDDAGTWAFKTPITPDSPAWDRLVAPPEPEPTGTYDAGWDPDADAPIFVDEAFVSDTSDESASESADMPSWASSTVAERRRWDDEFELLIAAVTPAVAFQTAMEPEIDAEPESVSEMASDQVAQVSDLRVADRMSWDAMFETASRRADAPPEPAADHVESGWAAEDEAAADSSAESVRSGWSPGPAPDAPTASVFGGELAATASPFAGLMAAEAASDADAMPEFAATIAEAAEDATLAATPSEPVASWGAPPVDATEGVFDSWDPAAPDDWSPEAVDRATGTMEVADTWSDPSPEPSAVGTTEPVGDTPEAQAEDRWWVDAGDASASIESATPRYPWMSAESDTATHEIVEPEPEIALQAPVAPASEGAGPTPDPAFLASLLEHHSVEPVAAREPQSEQVGEHAFAAAEAEAALGSFHADAPMESDDAMSAPMASSRELDEEAWRPAPHHEVLSDPLSWTRPDPTDTPEMATSTRTFSVLTPPESSEAETDEAPSADVPDHAAEPESPRVAQPVLNAMMTPEAQLRAQFRQRAAAAAAVPGASPPPGALWLLTGEPDRAIGVDGETQMSFGVRVALSALALVVVMALVFGVLLIFAK